MKFFVSSSNLQKHINSIASVVPAKSLMPIIQNIHFRLQDTQLYLTATDLENFVQTSLPVSVSEDSSGAFDVALPFKILQDTLKALPEQPVTFSMKEDSYSIQITSDTGVYKIIGLDGDDFPEFPNPGNTQSIDMPLNILNRAISNCIFATSNDELKKAMTGVYFQFKPEEGLTFAATDAHRLSVYTRIDLKAKEEAGFILPQKALKMIVSSTTDLEETDIVRLEYSSNTAFLKFGNTQMACRLIEGKFPNYNNVIPTSSPSKAVLNKNELLGCIRKLTLYSNKTTYLARFSFKETKLEVEAEDKDFATEAFESLNCLYDGDDLDIGFNLSLMTDVINNIETDDLILQLDTPGRAAIVLPSEQQKDENLLMLITPIMLSKKITAA